MLILDVQGQISRGGLVGRLLPLYFFNVKFSVLEKCCINLAPIIENVTGSITGILR